MKRLDVLGLYELGGRLAELREVLNGEKAENFEIFFALDRAETALKIFVLEHAAFTLAGDSAKDLLAEVTSAMNAHFRDAEDHSKFKPGLEPNAEIPLWSFYKVKSKLGGFGHVFSAECRRCETYFVEAKLGFDVSLLLHDAKRNLHSSIQPFIAAEAKSEVDAAGRCFALESYTASGFHILRALEVVISDYCKQVSGKDREYRSWYDYIEALEKLKESKEERGSKYPSPKLVAMLDRMRELDRNPLNAPSRFVG